MTETSVQQHALVRQLSMFGMWLLIANGMIGAGIFGVPAEAARLAGVFSPWIFMLCAVLIFPIMLCFAELASYFRSSGGPVAYATAAFGKAAGFQAGWALYVGRTTAFAANANLLVSAALLLSGVTAAPAVRVIMPGSIPLDIPSGRNIGAATVVIIYAFMGFESGPVAAGEARDPQRDIPLALMAALLVCAILYTLIQWAAVAAVPTLATSGRPLVDAATVLMGNTGTILLTVGVIVSVGGNLTGNMFTIPRITYRLAQDQCLPKWFGSIHPLYQTPVWSIVFFGALCFLLAVTGSFAWLAGLSVVIRLLLYLLCISGMPRIRVKFAEVTESWRLPAGGWITAIAVGECLSLLTQVTILTLLFTALFLVAGSILFIAAKETERP
jgi:amino acid transporter